MIEQYAEGFAQACDELWNPYPTRAAAQLLKLHERLDPGAERRVLDVGCGTGIVGAVFQRVGQLLRHQPGLDGLTQPDVVGEQQVDTRRSDRDGPTNFWLSVHKCGSFRVISHVEG